MLKVLKLRGAKEMYTIVVASSHTNAGEYIWHNIPLLSSCTTSNASYATTNTLYYPTHLCKQYKPSLVPRLPDLFNVSACNIEKLGIGPGNEASTNP